MGERKNAVYSGLNRIRKKRGMTRPELAERMGLEKTTIDKYLSGSREVGSKKLKMFADILECSIDEFFTE